MTDLETMREMLKQLATLNPNVTVTEEVHEHTQERGHVSLFAEGTAGYGGFVAVLHFDAEGRLIDVGGAE